MVAIGNILASAAVPVAMMQAFVAATDQPLAERLLRGLEAGEAAGGEHGDVWSASLLVVAEESFPLIDLRVDRMQHAITGLRALWTEYEPLADAFVLRATDPDRAIIT